MPSIMRQWTHIYRMACGAGLGLAALGFLPAAAATYPVAGSPFPAATEASVPVLVSASVPAPAAPTKPSSESQPVVLTADQIDYDQEHAFVIADGHVEVAQGERILLADSLTYDQRNNTVFAQGNVSVLDPSGSVYFADDMELADDMKTGVVAQFKERLSDNSLLVANKAERVSDTVTKLYQAVYSPCLVVCNDGKTPKEPLWAISANEATMDKGAQKITYHDAFMDVYGMPVLYTPYFSQPMPGADNKSGFLTPEFRRNANLGNIITLPIYWAIAPDRDLTLTPQIMTLDSPLLFGQYRERFDEGKMQIDASITSPHNHDASGTPEQGGSLRGHIFGKGDFALSDTEDWGFNVRRTTDDTYLRRYDINYDPLLTSRVYGEEFNYGNSDRSYAVAQGLSFQGLQTTDNPHASPFVLPLADMYYQTSPLTWDSRVTFSGGVMSLMRGEGDESRRVSGTAAWNVPYVTDSGHVFNLATSLRADAYSVNDVILANGDHFDGTTGRLVPETSLEWRYPLINRFASTNLLIEPMVQAIASPSGGNQAKIPNEDSAVPEFTDTNLFSDNRFAGYDRIENGPRVNYGMRSQLFFENNAAINGLLGQTYRTDENPFFPISKDPNSHFSDYVGMVGVSYQPLSLAYRFRVDKDNYTLNRNEVNAALGWPRFGLYTNFLDERADPLLGNKQDLSGGAAVRIGDNWTLGVGADRDLLRNAFVGANAALTYQNECITVQSTAGHDFTSDRDFRQGTSVKVQLFLKNLH